MSSVVDALDGAVLGLGDKLPSINVVCKEFSLSRDTVFSAYNELKAKGIISSSSGKGYYIQSTQVNIQKRVFLLFDELNPFKETLYNAFMESMGDRAMIDVYIHHFDKNVFKSLILENIHQYTDFVIMPCMFKKIYGVLNKIKGRVFILDQLPAEIGRKYPAVYQNFAKDMNSGLLSAKALLDKYYELVLVYPGGKEPPGIEEGFVKYCKDNNVLYRVIKNLEKEQLKKRRTYFVIDDLDLVSVVKQSKEREFKIGEDIGIVSFNDSPLKEVVANGITTISTDFAAMGRELAELVLQNKAIQIENPSSLLVRGSL